MSETAPVRVALAGCGRISRSHFEAIEKIDDAVAKAAETIRNIHWFEVVETRGHVENGKVAHWQVTIKVGFTLED